MQNILSNKLILEEANGYSIERIPTPRERAQQLEYWNSLSEEEQTKQINEHYSNLKAESDYKNSINKVGLLYFHLDENNNILYIGSSKNTNNDRLLQNDRMRSKFKPSKITANDIGYEYGNRIKSVVIFKLKNYRNIESHLIFTIKPEFNTNSMQNYTSNWQLHNSSINILSCYSTDFLNAFHDNGKFNTSKCPVYHEVKDISEYMMKKYLNIYTNDHINSNNELNEENSNE